MFRQFFCLRFCEVPCFADFSEGFGSNSSFEYVCLFLEQQAAKKMVVSQELVPRFVALNVRCAATGRGHGDRAVCRIVAVGEDGKMLFDRAIKVPKLYHSMSAMSGLTAAMIQKGMDFEAALKDLRNCCLGFTVVLVGQDIHLDIERLQLRRVLIKKIPLYLFPIRQGVDFFMFVDLGLCFRSWNHKEAHWNYFSLREEAYGLLDRAASSSLRDPQEDAKISMLLYTRFLKPGPDIARNAVHQLQRMRFYREFPPSLSKRPNIPGICCAP